MPLRKKLLLSMLIPAVLLCVVGMGGIYSLGRLEQAAGSILADNYRSIQETRRMESALRRLEQSDRDKRQNRVGVQRGQVGTVFDDALRQCEGNITEVGEADIVRRIRRAWTDLLPLLLGPQEKIAEPSSVGHDAIDRLYGDLDALIALNERAMFEYEHETRRTASVMRVAVICTGLFAVFALAFFAALMASRISRPVVEVADRLHTALNPGEPLGKSRGGQGRDEIARLRMELDALLIRLAQYDATEQRRFDESRRRFISMLSHQLKTPMTSLSMSVNLLREKLKGASAAETELLSIAAESCNSLSALVSDLIEAAQGVTADLSLTPRRVDIVRLLRSALRPLVPQAEEKGVTLIVPPEVTPIFASADPVKFPWVITNIAGNALRYTKSGGVIEIDVNRISRWITVTVQDTGKGISAENIDRIFLPYVSLDDEPDSFTHGLGLAIAKEIMEAHGGAIEAESEPGRGARFTVFLPA